MERSLNVVTAEIAIIKQQIELLRKDYLGKRSAVILELKTNYDKDLRKLNSKLRRYQGQLTDNIVKQLNNPGRVYTPDSENNGWIIKSWDDLVAEAKKTA